MGDAGEGPGETKAIELVGGTNGAEAQPPMEGPSPRMPRPEPWYRKLARRAPRPPHVTWNQPIARATASDGAAALFARIMVGVYEFVVVILAGLGARWAHRAEQVGGFARREAAEARELFGRHVSSGLEVTLDPGGSS